MGLNKVYIKITRENIYKDDEFCIKNRFPQHTHWPFWPQSSATTIRNGPTSF